MGRLVNRFQKEIIPPSTYPKAMKDTSKPNAEIQDIMSESDLLSVLFYDGNSITVNELFREKLRKSDKMYSMSISKSYVGYLVGHAICDGFIKSLSDPIEKYGPQTTGTLYEGVSIQNMINMSAGDGDHWGDRNILTEYAMPIQLGKRTIKDVLEGSRGANHREHADFRYSNIIPDLVARAIHLSVPSGLGNYFPKNVSNPANYSSGMFYLKD
jgi:CubicO group peptidase (beta-lactamase class C family)